MRFDPRDYFFILNDSNNNLQSVVDLNTIISEKVGNTTNNNFFNKINFFSSPVLAL